MSTVYHPKSVVTLQITVEDYSIKSDARFVEKHELKIKPRRCNVNINDYTQADTFSIELDYKYFPFDPRTIRALGVSVHMEDTGNIATDIVPSRENAVFQGFADKEAIEMDEQNRTVKIEGRDFTGLLIDAPYPKNSTVNMSAPLEDILQGILDSLPATENMKIDNRTNEVLPNIGKFAPDFNPMAGQKNVKRDDTYWDVIQDLIGRAGLIAFVELDLLVITKPRVLYKKDQPRRFVFGKNLKNLSFERKLGRQKGMNIRVISLDIEGKNLVEALIPEEASVEWSESIGVPRQRIKVPKAEVRSFGKEKKAKTGTTQATGTTKADAEEEDAPFTTFRVADVKSKSHLVTIGEKIYEELGRQQLEGSMGTKEMTLLQNSAGKSDRFNILKTKNGTPVGIEIEQVDMENIRRLSSESERINYFEKTGKYPKSVAAALGKAYGRLPMVFYTKAVEFTMDNDQGFECKIDFINFIDIDQRVLR